MDKKPSFAWALVIGLVFPILQALIFFLRFGSFNTEAPITDYLFIYLAGAVNGLGLIYLLRRSQTRGAYRGTIVGFVLGLPLAMFGMIFGGMVGVVGILMFGVSPCLFFTGIGHFIGRAFSKK